MAGLPKKPSARFMKVFFDVTCLVFIPRAFKGSEGEDVSYNEVSFLNQTEDGQREVIRLNTKQGSKDWEDKAGVLGVEIDPTGKQKPKLVSFIPKLS